MTDFVDLTSGGSLTYVLAARPAGAPNQTAPDATAALVARIEQHTKMTVVDVTATAAEARRSALDLARRSTGRTHLVACRGTDVPSGTRLVSHGDTMQTVRAFEQEQPAAFVLEIVQASNATCVPPPKYLLRLREGCDANGVRLVVDETAVGFARTGALFAIEREKTTADLMVVSLAVAPGVDGGLVLARPELGFDEVRTASSAAPAALAVLEAIERDRLVDRVKATGKTLQKRLHEILETRRRWAMDTRGRGLLHSLTLWDDPRPAIENARARGVVLTSTGANGLLFAPPIDCTEEALNRTMAVVDEVLSDR